MKEELKKKLLASSEEYVKLYLPHISVDCVIFGFHNDCLKVLLVRLDGEKNWLLPGGFVEKEEDIFNAAHRILMNRTGASNIFLTQFKTYGAIRRSEDFFSGMPDDLFHKKRFITIGYYALIDFTTLDPTIDTFSDACSWHSIEKLPKLGMDHQDIYKGAIMQLRRDLNYVPVGYNLLPEKFTMPQLQRLYEVILDKKLNRGNFYRRMMRYHILIKLNEKVTGFAHTSPNLYKFDQQQYQKALENGFQYSW